MRRAIGILLAIVCAACAPSALPSAEPTAAPSSEPSAAPSEIASTSPLPSPSPATPPIETSPPAVRVVSGRIEISAAPALAAGAAPAGFDQGLEWWGKNYLQLLGRASTPSAGQATTEILGPWVRGPYADILARSLVSGPRSFEFIDVTLERTYWKPWGSAAFSEVTLRYRERHGGLLDDRTQRLRIIPGGQGMMITVDAFDAASGAWLSGDRPQYSGLLLESEVANALSWHLHSETYAPGTGKRGWLPQEPTPYERWRAAFIASLDTRYESGMFSARRLDEVSARILRFEPASFLGDGVVTVRFDARVVSTTPTGEVSTKVAQTMRFFRSTLGGWSAIDEELPGGAWASGGDLALAQVDRFKG